MIKKHQQFDNDKPKNKKEKHANECQANVRCAQLISCVTINPMRNSCCCCCLTLFCDFCFLHVSTWVRLNNKTIIVRARALTFNYVFVRKLVTIAIRFLSILFIYIFFSKKNTFAFKFVYVRNAWVAKVFLFCFELINHLWIHSQCITFFYSFRLLLPECKKKAFGRCWKLWIGLGDHLFGFSARFCWKHSIVTSRVMVSDKQTFVFLINLFW